MRHLANLEPDPVVEEPAAENKHSEPPSRRELTPRQLALWKAMQQEQAQGLSLRAISRQLGIHRNTVRKYAHSLTQPTNRPINRRGSRTHQTAKGQTVGRRLISGISQLIPSRRYLKH